MSCNNCNTAPCNCVPATEIPCLTCDCNPGYCDEGCPSNPKSGCVIVDTDVDCLNITAGNTLNQALIKIKDQVCIVQNVEDKFVKISADDTIANYLNEKIVGSSTLSVLESNIAGNALLTLASKISTFTGNVLTDKMGLYVGTEDTPTIGFTILGIDANKKIKADVLISNDANNQLYISNGGLFVGAAALETVLTANDSDTIDFTSSGTSGHTLTGNVKISSLSGNILTNSTGLFVQGKSVSNGINETIPNVFKLGAPLTENTSLTGNYYLNIPDGKFGVGTIPTETFEVVSGTGKVSFNGIRLTVKNEYNSLFVGEFSGEFNTSINNIALGTASLYASAGIDKIGIGNNSGFTHIGNNLISIGHRSSFTTDGDDVIIIGTEGALHSNTDKAVMIGSKTTAGNSLATATVANSNIIINSNTISGLSSFISASGLSIGSKSAFNITFLGTYPSIAGVQLITDFTFKGEITNANTITLYQSGQFTNIGSGNFTINVYENTTNVIAIGYLANANQSNQVALGNSNISSLKIGRIELKIGTKTISLPEATTTERNAISSPVANMMLYDTTVNKISIHNGTSWKYLAYE